MWVVKLGGSLARSPRLVEWVTTLAEEGAGRVVLVPGGGPFADLVRAEQRRAGFPDSIAHRMAILAMGQFGFMLEHLHPRLRTAATEAELRAALDAGDVPVWLAWPMAIRDDALPRNWTATADSLALWLALRMRGEALLLIKSAPVPDGIRDVTVLSRLGMLDEHFPVLAARYDGAISMLACHEAARARDGLVSGDSPGILLTTEAPVTISAP
jgi:aspartokinase-like uncharacterized kinase